MFLVEIPRKTCSMCCPPSMFYQHPPIMYCPHPRPKSFNICEIVQGHKKTCPTQVQTYSTFLKTISFCIHVCSWSSKKNMVYQPMEHTLQRGPVPIPRQHHWDIFHIMLCVSFVLKFNNLKIVVYFGDSCAL